jgi:ribose 5-phosphate isomerase A
MPVASPEQLEKIGALAALEVKANDRVGLGSGRAALAFVRSLGKRVREEKLGLTCVSTSLLTEKVAREAGITLSTLAQVTALDIAVDGADEVDPQLNLIKGGGGNLTREKVVESIAKRLIIVVGEEKVVQRLGTNFPVFVEVIEFALPMVIRKLQAMGGSVERRKNADGTNFLTDNNNPYLHVRFGPPPHYLDDPGRIDHDLRVIPGVLETGLFVGMASEAIVAYADGRVETKRRN